MSRIPDALIERVHLGEASEAERARVLADPDARARLEGLPAADAAFLAAHPADEVVRAIERRVHLRETEDAVRQRRSTTRLGAALAVPLLVAAGALVWTFQGGAPVDPTSDPGLERTTAKWGDGARLFVWRDHDGVTERLTDGDLARAGDRLMIKYAAMDATHGVIVSVDGRGAVTLHHPADPGGSTALGGGTRELDHGYELDDAPVFERFYLVSDDVPVDVDAVLAAAETVASGGLDRERLPLPERLEQTTVILRKEVR